MENLETILKNKVISSFNFANELLDWDEQKRNVYELSDEHKLNLAYGIKTGLIEQNQIEKLNFGNYSPSEFSTRFYIPELM